MFCIECTIFIHSKKKKQKTNFTHYNFYNQYEHNAKNAFKHIKIFYVIAHIAFILSLDLLEFVSYGHSMVVSAVSSWHKRLPGLLC